MSENLLTAEQVAELVGVPARTVGQWRHVRRGPVYVRVGRHIRYRSEDVDAWIVQRRVDPASHTRTAS